jgi:hypothetical protein
MKLKSLKRNMKITSFVLFLLIAFACTTVTKKESVNYGNIVIVGDKNFIVQTQKALALLKEKDHKAYFFSQTYLSRIVLSKNSGVKPWQQLPTYEVGQLTAYYGLEWYASTIAHEAFHSKLYFDYLNKNPDSGRIPETIWSGQEAELKSLNYQYRVLKKLGATLAMLRYLHSVSESEYWNHQSIYW